MSPFWGAGDEEAAALTALSEKLGTIEVQMFEVERFESNPGSLYAVQGVTDIGPVHEKSKKAGVHAVSSVRYDVSLMPRLADAVSL